MYVICGELYKKIVFERGIHLNTFSILALLHTLSTSYDLFTSQVKKGLCFAWRGNCIPVICDHHCLTIWPPLSDNMTTIVWQYDHHCLTIWPPLSDDMTTTIWRYDHHWLAIWPPLSDNRTTIVWRYDYHCLTIWPLLSDVTLSHRGVVIVHHHCLTLWSPQSGDMTTIVWRYDHHYLTILPPLPDDITTIV
jgi:hypothetical protein